MTAANAQFCSGEDLNFSTSGTTIATPATTSGAQNAWTANCTPGSKFHAYAVCNSNTTVSVADPTNGIYTQEDLVWDASSGTLLAHFVVDNTSSAKPIVTATFGAATQTKGIAVEEDTGVASGSIGTAHNIQVQGAPGAGTDAVSSGTFATGTLPGLLSGLSIDTQGIGGPAAGTGFTGSGLFWAFGGGALARFETKRITTGNPSAVTFTGSAGRSYITAGALLVEAGAAPAVLTAASGTYAITGEAVTLTSGLPVANGTYSIAGQAATLSMGTGNFTLLAVPGSYALFGLPSNSNIQLDAANGSYAIVGENTQSGISLAAAFGAYTLTGEAVTFTQSGGGATLTADFGTYSIAGQAIQDGISLPAAFGSYALTGQIVTFSQGSGQVTLAADFGVYTLTGGQINPPIPPPQTTGSNAPTSGGGGGDRTTNWSGKFEFAKNKRPKPPLVEKRAKPTVVKADMERLTVALANKPKSQADDDDDDEAIFLLMH